MSAAVPLSALKTNPNDGVDLPPLGATIPIEATAAIVEAPRPTATPGLVRSLGAPEVTESIGLHLDPTELAALARTSRAVYNYTADVRSRALAHHLQRSGTAWIEEDGRPTWAEQEARCWEVELSRVGQVAQDQLLYGYTAASRRPHPAPGEEVEIRSRASALEGLARRIGPYSGPGSDASTRNFRSNAGAVQSMIKALGTELRLAEQRVGAIRELIWSAADVDDLASWQWNQPASRHEPTQFAVRRAIESLAPPDAVEWLTTLSDLYGEDRERAMSAFVGWVESRPETADVTWAVEAVLRVSRTSGSRAQGPTSVAMASVLTYASRWDGFRNGCFRMLARTTPSARVIEAFAASVITFESEAETFERLCDLAQQGLDRGDEACVVAVIPAFGLYFHPAFIDDDMVQEDAAPVRRILDMASSMEDDGLRARALHEFLAITSMMLPGDEAAHLSIASGLLRLAENVPARLVVSYSFDNWIDGTDKVLDARKTAVDGTIVHTDDISRFSDDTWTFLVKPAPMLIAWVQESQKGFTASGSVWITARARAETVCQAWKTSSAGD